VGRYLRPVSIATDQPIPTGARVLVEQGKQVGHVTSSAYSPALGRTVALAYLKRAYAEPGNRLEIQTERGTYQAQVSESARAASHR
jgi:sarcosine oxidase subunit alpha